MNWRYGWPTGPKAPPPEHGIRLERRGLTWWGKQWINALEEVLKGDNGRLARGKTYAFGGRVHDLVVTPGHIRAQVTGSRVVPYAVDIHLKTLTDAEWRKGIAVMAGRAQHSAALLAGEMPQDIDDAFIGARASLFPLSRKDLQIDCSCPDYGDPCKHVAATHYVFGDALDRDPFLLFELRGRTKAQVLEALRAARVGDETEVAAMTTTATKKKKAKKAVDEPAREPAEVRSSVLSVKFGAVSDEDYDRLRTTLPSIVFHFDETTTGCAPLRQLGPPRDWREAQSPVESLAPAIRAAADLARRLAMATPDDDDMTG